MERNRFWNITLTQYILSHILFQQSNNAQQLLSQTLLAAQAMGITNSEILRWATDTHASSLGAPQPQQSGVSNHMQHSPMAIDEELPLDLSLAGRASVGSMGTGVKSGQQKRPKKVGRANSQGGVGGAVGASQFQQQQGIPLPSSIFPSP